MRLIEPYGECSFLEKEINYEHLLGFKKGKKRVIGGGIHIKLFNWID